MKNQKLVSAREEKNISQEELANLLKSRGVRGVSGKSTVSNWENGYSSPSIQTAFVLADILDKDIAFLFNQKVQDSHTNGLEVC
jgi:putative transcriptional regulator